MRSYFTSEIVLIVLPKIWSLDGRVVQVLDRSHTLSMALDPSAPDPQDITPARVRPCVRDVSWHSQVGFSNCSTVLNILHIVASF